MLAQRITLLAKPQLALAFQDQEHFLFAVMAVKRALHLARRHDGQIVAQVPRTDMAADRAAHRGVDAILLDIVERDLIQVHHWLDHTHLPMLAERITPSRMRMPRLAMRDNRRQSGSEPAFQPPAERSTVRSN